MMGEKIKLFSYQIIIIMVMFKYKNSINIFVRNIFLLWATSIGFTGRVFDFTAFDSKRFSKYSSVRLSI